MLKPSYQDYKYYIDCYPNVKCYCRRVSSGNSEETISRPLPVGQGGAGLALPER